MQDRMNPLNWTLILMTDMENNEISGLQAIFQAAMECRIELVHAVAGFPITSVIEHFEQNCPDNVETLWLTNEKVALEASLGASVCGRRSLVLTKHVGMNILSDPLITSITHTIGAGVVILTGDDPGVRASQNEQDSRWYGEIAETAVFDPSTPSTAYSAVLSAFKLSEKVSVPVIIRITDRLLKSTQRELTSTDQAPPSYPPQPFDPCIWELTMRGRHQYYHSRAHPLLQESSEKSPLNPITGNKENAGKRAGVISSGYPSYLADQVLSSPSAISHLSLGQVCPLPVKLIRDFIDDHERVLIIEETEPFIEKHLCACRNILGKSTGHLPYGRIEKEHIRFALDHIEEDTVKTTPDIQTLRSRGYRSFCEECPFIPIYKALQGLDIFIAGDMGCSLKSGPAPWNVINASFALGSAISVACGADKKAIAIIGDFALAHSGMIGLINAVHNKRDILVLVIDNNLAAMTGGQDAPDLSKAVKALCSDVTEIDLDTFIPGIEGIEKDLFNLISEKIELNGVKVIYFKGLCRKFGSKTE